MVLTPKISIVMPVLNCEKFLKYSIRSILNQSYTNFQFIIVSEFGNSRLSKKIIDSYNDKRIIHIENTIKKNLALTRNIGIKIAQGEYVAIFDADDISHKNRLFLQKKYLEKNPEIGVLGSGSYVINSSNQILGVNTPISNILYQKWSLLFGNNITHSSLLIRKSVLNELKGYNENYFYAHDYELLMRALIISKIMAIPELLLYYRIHRKNITSKFRDIQKINSSNCIRNYLFQSLKLDVPRKIISIFLDYGNLKNHYDFLKAIQYLMEIQKSFLKHNPTSEYERQLINNFIILQQMRLIKNMYKNNPKMFFALMKSAHNSDINFKNLFKSIINRGIS